MALVSAFLGRLSLPHFDDALPVALSGSEQISLNKFVDRLHAMKATLAIDVTYSLALPCRPEPNSGFVETIISDDDGPRAEIFVPWSYAGPKSNREEDVAILVNAERAIINAIPDASGREVRLLALETLNHATTYVQLRSEFCSGPAWPTFVEARLPPEVLNALGTSWWERILIGGGSLGGLISGIVALATYLRRH